MAIRANNDSFFPFSTINNNTTNINTDSNDNNNNTTIIDNLNWLPKIIKILHCSGSIEQLDPPKYPWSHLGPFSSYKHDDIRRGYQVYKQVCSQCHSLKRIAYRHLVGVSHTLEEAKQEASEAEITDGPNDEGKMFTRPGKISDRLPSPYPNDEAARAANNGALPPDLSLITKARPNGGDYVFSLLTGYSDPPPGVEVKGNLYYNRYFYGGAIAMAQSLYDGLVDYDDGTEATASQMAKDVTTFLTWASEPELEERRIMGTKALILVSSLTLLTLYWKRHVWSTIKNAKFVYKSPPNKD